ncbi:MAG: hypothetical protein GPJ54_15015 [Candidatus Heimdallarchaeota archaeon]|nr:hypothetical protein [Candidatus Heimdallarchaeota archaeon]
MRIEIVTERQLNEIVELLKLYFDFYEVNHPSYDKLQFLVSLLTGGTNHGIQFIAYHLNCISKILNAEVKNIRRSGEMMPPLLN